MISGNFLFITVSWSRFLLYQRFNKFVCGVDTLDSIRCLGALHFCNFYELFQLIRTLLQVLLLFTRFFIDGCYITKDVRVLFLFSDFFIVEFSHSLNLL